LLCSYCAKIPVIIDTDIGQDCDDSWAIALSLKRPELDIKMILTAAHNPAGRAQIVAKYLTTVGRTEIPIGIGVHQDDFVGPLYGWAQDFNVSSYPGGVYTDGIGEAIKIIDASPQTITIIEIAPVPNLQELFKRRPDLTSKVLIKAMSGSIKVCYGGGVGPCPEYNVNEDVPASKIVYNISWNGPMTITPIDTGYLSVIDGAGYQSLLNAQNNIILETLIQNYIYWQAHGGWGDPKTASTVLWDPVAAYLTWSDSSFVNLVPLTLSVDNNGNTVIDSKGKLVLVALTWKDKIAPSGIQAWKQEAVKTLLS